MIICESRMRIGILTLPLHTNYGGILQAYALQTVLERMGHEVVVYQKEIEPRYELPFWKYPLAYAKRMIKKIFVDRKQPIFVEQKLKKEFPITRQYTNRFIKKYIHTVYIDSPNDIDLSAVDCIVVGSDQIWRPYHVYNLYKTDVTCAFLKFAEEWDGKKIVYAASFGMDHWEYDNTQTEECKRLAKLFDAISVREQSAIKLCKDNLEIKAEHVLDPTLLLEKEDYVKLINNISLPPSDGQLFNYILDETAEKRAFVYKIAEQLEMKPYSMSLASWKITDPLNKRIAQPVEKWLRCFFDAKFVVTDSFHGCVFSIIFGKPFIAIGNEERGMSRFKSLLSMFEMESRLVTSLDNVNIASIQEHFDESEIVNSLRKHSFNYLHEALG